MNKIKSFLNSLAQAGIPIPLIRDYKSGQPSVSLTMMLISFVVCVVGLIGKFTHFLDGVDTSQALTLLTITSALYFGRTVATSNSRDAAAANLDKDQT